MESRLIKIKGDFNNIINIRNSVKNVFDILQVRIDKLKIFYQEFIQNNKSEMFVFGLDSFHFQSKLIDIEYDDMKRLFLAISNRMYCEYFKLNKIIIEYISKNINDKKILELTKINNNYPTYKDLEPFKEYKFEIILDIHENILNLLGILISMLSNKENELCIHKTKLNIGLNIDNFITSFNFNISVMREKIIMFINYLEFFHKMHTKYLKRFSNKIQLMYTHINNDIKFDDSIEISKDKKKELIDEFSFNNMDRQLLKDLKTSIGSETNSEASSDISKSMPNTPKLDVNNEQNDKKENLTNLYTDSKSIFLNGTPNKYQDSKGYKNIFQKNVHKVTDMFKLFKSRKDKLTQNDLSNMEIDKMFYGIEESCDSIIFEKNESKIGLKPDDIGLRIDSFDNTIDEKTPDKTENQIILRMNELDNIYNHNNNSGLNIINDNTFSKTEILETIEETQEIKNEINYNSDVQNNNQNNLIIEEENSIFPEDVQHENTIINNDEVKTVKTVNEDIEVNLEPTKKKRTYNRKKK